MDIQILKEFADLAYTLNYNKTAERMYIGQSTLSKHIIAMEKELDAQLFTRSKQAVTLTEAGRRFLPKIQKTLEDYEEALRTVRQSKDELSGSLRIGFLDAAVRNLLTAAIQRYRNLYPNMKISLTSCQVGELADAFKNNAVDLMLSIMFPNSFLPPDTRFLMLYADGISAVIPREHSLTKKEQIYFNDLLRYPLILPSPNQYPVYAQMIREYVNSASYPANIICDYTHIDTALIMVESGMGVSVLPTNISANATTAEFRKIEDCNPILKVGITWKKSNHSVGLNEFVDILLDEAEKEKI